jgi:hypothetical protein
MMQHDKIGFSEGANFNAGVPTKPSGPNEPTTNHVFSRRIKSKQVVNQAQSPPENKKTAQNTLIKKQKGPPSANSEELTTQPRTPTPSSTALRKERQANRKRHKYSPVFCVKPH